MDEVNIRNSDLKNIKNELHQLNVFMGHICEIFDSLIAKDVIIKTHIPKYKLRQAKRETFDKECTDKLDTNSTPIPGA